ncbi:hypothetical protein BC827DRAFT_955068 [Russula dissimulans]|nr:hypothetical protein BC827DRAFT_955068 [Russula dissimulans]
MRSVLRTTRSSSQRTFLSVLKSCSMRLIHNHLPLALNLSTPDYVPTCLLISLRRLHTHFPRHRLLLSDFSSLSNVILGVNTLAVQVRMHGAVVACSTLFVRSGLFDIFPTHFGRLRDIHECWLAQPHATND